MALSATDLYVKHKEDHDLEFTREEGSNGKGDPLNVHEFHLTRSAEEWEEFLQARHVPAARVRSMGEAVADPHLASRGIIHRHDQAPGIEGPFGVPLAAFTFAHGGPRIDTPPPRLGEHNDEVFGELGIGRLRKAKGERPSRAP